MGEEEVAPNGWPLFFMTNGFLTDNQTDFLDGRIFGRTVLKKVLNGFLTYCQKKVLNRLFRALFWGIFGQFWVNFGNFLGKIELFP